MSWVGTSGYAVAAQGYLHSLLHAGFEVGWTPLFPNDPRTGGWSRAPSTATATQAVAELCCDDADAGERAVDNGEIVRALIDSIAADDANGSIIHIVPEAWPAHRGRERVTIGNTVWETDRLPAHWAELLNSVDGVIVPCRMNRTVMQECGVSVPIHVVPHVEPRFGPEPTEEETAEFRARLDIPEAHTIFYCIEDWNPRKAPYKTIAAYLSAFDGHDDVTLIVKTGLYGPRSGAEHRYVDTIDLAGEIVAGFDNPANLVVLSGDMPRRLIDRLHALGDCYISLTHGEGWGIGAYEAATQGNPVITTGWGGSLDYLGQDWPYLIDYELVPVMYLSGLPSFHPTQRWAAADRDHAIELMRSVASDPEVATRRTEQVAARIRADFSVASTSTRLAAVFDQ